MIFRWLNRRRRRRLLAEPCPERFPEFLDRSPHVRMLPDEYQGPLLDAVRIFIAEKEWEGCKGLEVTDDMKVVIAGQACLMTLGMSEVYYDHVQTILVYPRSFRVRKQVGLEGGAILEDVDERLGEAHLHGPVILSWQEIEEDLESPGEGRNLVIHEFAHQLDMQNGDATGVPPLPRALRQPWEKLMGQAFQRLQRDERRGRRTFFDPYGAESPAEFFAVLSETFFDAPRAFVEVEPKLYELLREYYGLDPAAWNWEEFV